MCRGLLVALLRDRLVRDLRQVIAAGVTFIAPASKNYISAEVLADFDAASRSTTSPFATRPSQPIGGAARQSSEGDSRFPGTRMATTKRGRSSSFGPSTTSTQMLSRMFAGAVGLGVRSSTTSMPSATSVAS